MRSAPGIKGNLLRFGGAAALAAAADLGTKALVQARFAPFERVEVAEGFFALTYVMNPGAAFGMFSGLPDGVRLLFLGVVTLVALLVMCWAAARLEPHRRAALWGLGLIGGGAVGNLVDRFRFGAVVDFLDLYWKSYHWPTFNVADIAISVGVGLLLLSEFRPAVGAKDAGGGP